jgi:hypothetical protein
MVVAINMRRRPCLSDSTGDSYPGRRTPRGWIPRSHQHNPLSGTRLTYSGESCGKRMLFIGFCTKWNKKWACWLGESCQGCQFLVPRPQYKVWHSIFCLLRITKPFPFLIHIFLDCSFWIVATMTSEKSFGHRDEPLATEKRDEAFVEDARSMDEKAQRTRGDYSGAVAKTDPAEIRLVRKLDRRIMPIIWAMYFLNYVSCLPSNGDELSTRPDVSSRLGRPKCHRKRTPQRSRRRPRAAWHPV